MLHGCFSVHFCFAFFIATETLERYMAHVCELIMKVLLNMYSCVTYEQMIAQAKKKTTKGKNFKRLVSFPFAMA